MNLMNILTKPVWVFDIDNSRVLWANDAAVKLWGAGSAAELRARRLSAEMSNTVSTRLRQYQADFERSDVTFSEVWTLYPNGHPQTFRGVFKGYRLADGRMGMLVEVLGDVQSDPDSMRSAEALMHTTMMVTSFNMRGRAIYRNPASRQAVDNPAATALNHFCDRSDFRNLIRQISGRGEGRVLARVRTDRGERWHEISAKRAIDSVSGKTAIVVSEVDISDLKQAENRAQYLAMHDTLTGLPNRYFVVREFQKKLDETCASGEQLALLCMDLDRFKNVNDSLGHSAGDRLLIKMAQRLRAAVRSHDLIARLGGDEFLVLTSGPDADARAQQLSARLVQSLGQPIILDNIEVSVTPSVGVAVAPRDGESIDALMRFADLAMYKAKASGRNKVVFFDAHMSEAAQSRIPLEAEIRLGLERGEFEPWFQPRVNVATGEVVGAEALARWRSPRRGLVSPAVFIPVCEETGNIIQLGAQMFHHAASQQVAWRDVGHDLRVSVNLSPRQFNDDGLLQMIRSVIHTTNCDPTQIEIEVTESVLLGNDEKIIRTLDEIRSMGFRVSIDDFGTGYSNLAYLQRYPITCLKIDRSFVDMLDVPMPIAQVVMTMCNMLKIEVVAEGVETAEQLLWLQDKGCQEYQGYYFSPPVPAADFLELLKKHRSSQLAIAG